MFVQRLIIAMALWSACLGPGIVLAHDGPPRLELNAEQLNPGGALEVRGVNLTPEQPITPVLVGAGSEFPLGAATSDAHGDFTQVFVLPVDVMSGDYAVRASDPTNMFVDTPLRVAGTAVTAEDEGGQRDEDEPLLAPLPISPRVVSTPPQRTAAPVEPPAPPPQAGAWWPLAFGAAVAATLGLAVLVRRKTMSAR